METAVETRIALDVRATLDYHISREVWRLPGNPDPRMLDHLADDGARYAALP